MQSIIDHPTVLVVEDSLDDFRVIQRAFRGAGAEVSLLHFQKAELALEHLEQCVREKNGTPLPCLILLDLNLPGMDGAELLDSIRATDATRCIPVIVFTTSDDPRDIDRCYRAGANAYLRKPVELHRFKDALTALCRFWLEAAVLPERARDNA